MRHIFRREGWAVTAALGGTKRRFVCYGSDGVNGRAFFKTRAAARAYKASTPFRCRVVKAFMKLTIYEAR